MSHGAPDYTGRKVDIVLRPEWAVVSATSKDFELLAANKTFGQSGSGSYAVPAGKRLYVVSYEAHIYPRAQPAAYDLLYARVQLYHTDPTVIMSDKSGLGGVGQEFRQPKLIIAGQTFTYAIFSYALVTVDMGLYIHGYEV